MTEMWIAILIAPALMTMALVLHHLEASLVRPERRRDGPGGVVRTPPEATPVADDRPRPWSDHRGPRATPTLP